MKSCFSFENEMKTEEVIPAKQVTEAALTFKKKETVQRDKNTERYLLCIR